MQLTTHVQQVKKLGMRGVIPLVLKHMSTSPHHYENRCYLDRILGAPKPDQAFWQSSKNDVLDKNRCSVSQAAANPFTNSAVDPNSNTHIVISSCVPSG